MWIGGQFNERLCEHRAGAKRLRPLRCNRLVCRIGMEARARRALIAAGLCSIRMAVRGKWCHERPVSYGRQHRPFRARTCEWEICCFSILRAKWHTSVCTSVGKNLCTPHLQVDRSRSRDLIPHFMRQRSFAADGRANADPCVKLFRRLRGISGAVWRVRCTL